VSEHVEPSQGMQYQGTAYEGMLKDPEVFSGVPSLLGGSADFDSKNVDMGLNMWGNCSMDIDMCANNAMDFSNQVSVHGLWFHESSESLIPSLPSPPSTTSTGHSRINSTSPTWSCKNELPSQDPSNQLLDLNSSMIPELDLVVASEDAWPMAKCNPRIFSGSCPRTAYVHLESLQNCSKLEGAWDSMNDLISPSQQNTPGLPFEIITLHTTTRDKIIAFAQSFLIKALTTHRSGMRITPHGHGSSQLNFFTLPPSNVLENLLRCSVRSLSPYFSLINGMSLDPNELMLDNDTSTLLFLLMMAQGASTVPKVEARYLAAGLTETCRISLFDVIEKNVELSADPVVLKSAFLFTQLGAWGGDAWRKFFFFNLGNSNQLPGFLLPMVTCIPYVGWH
jgi:hypothetical protein